MRPALRITDGVGRRRAMCIHGAPTQVTMPPLLSVPKDDINVHPRRVLTKVPSDNVGCSFHHRAAEGAYAWVPPVKDALVRYTAAEVPASPKPRQTGGPVPLVRNRTPKA